ncbi:hypothetical protein BV372_18020, partial [Nostoc sp. T09]|uniref:putative Ig domain-containing protein n=1 Tax=Nostoc sp. T09 TaxID=1932621 RepID=UPI000A37333F
VEDSFSVDEDNQLEDNILTNDKDPDNNIPLTANLVSQPENGTVTLNSNGSFIYQPKKDFSGEDSFTYIAKDNQNLASTPATVTITVKPINDLPVAVEDKFTLNLNSENRLDVLANDKDVDNDKLTAVLVQAPKEGKLTQNSDSSFTYTPNPTVSGLDYFTYRADDGNGGISALPTNVIVEFYQPEPLRVKGIYKQLGETSFQVSGNVEVGFINKAIPFPFNPLITIKNGGLEYDETNLQAKGVVYSSLAGLSQPLFTGNFTIPTGQTTTEALLDESSNNNSQLTLAGLDINITKLQLRQNAIALQGAIQLPNQFNSVSVEVSGDNWLLIQDSGISLSGAKVPGVDFEFGNLLQGKTGDLTLSYQDKPQEEIKIQGSFEVTSPVLRNAKATANFSAPSSYFLIQDAKVDAVGQLSLENLAIVPDKWELRKAVLTLDTPAGKVTGEAEVLFPFGLEIDTKLGFQKVGEDWELNEVRVQVGELPEIPNIPLKIRNLDASIMGLADEGADITATVHNIKITDTLISIPTITLPWGGSFSGYLAELDLSGTIDKNKLDAAGELTLAGGLVKGTGDITLDWNQYNLNGGLSFQALSGLINAKASIQADADLNFSLTGSGSLKIPDYQIFRDLNLEGVEIAKGLVALNFTNDSNYSNDYIVAGGKIPGVSFVLDLLDFPAGIQVYFNGDVKALGLKKLEEIEAESLPAEASTSLTLGTDTPLSSRLDAPNFLTITQQALSLAQSDLKMLSASPTFASTFDTAFGSTWSQEVAATIRQSWLAGDFSYLPQIELVSASNISNANAAYADSTETIYLAKEFLAEHQADLGTIAGVLLEEVGHWVDAQVNPIDSPGDEGAIFSSLIRGEALSAQQLQLLRAEDDTVTVTLNGAATQLNLNSTEVNQAVYSVGAYTPFIILSADWVNNVGTPDFQLQAPDGTIYTAANILNASNIFVDQDLGDSTRLVIAVKQPAAGNWSLKLLSNGDLGTVDFAAIGGTNAPTIAIPSLTQDTANQTVTINYNAVDADSQAKLSFYYDTDQEGFDGSLIAKDIAETDNSGSYVWNTTGITPGDYYVYALAQDDDSVPVLAYSSSKVSIGNNGPADNNAPELTGTQSTLSSGTEDTFYIINTSNLLVGFSDPDSDSLSVINLTATNGTLSNNNDGTYTFNPNLNFNGTVTFTYTINDGKGGSTPATQSFTITPVNDAPTLNNAIADQTALKDTTFTFTLPGNTFTDVDAGDSLTYSTTLENGNPLPGWLTFDSATQTFTGTPANGNIGSLNVKVIATDKAGASASDIFTLTVANTLEPILLQSTTGDGNLQVTVDSYGAFGTAQTGGQGGVYDPLGTGTPASTVYQSYLAARIGSSGSRTRLTNNALSSTGFTQSDTTSAQSSFTFQGLNFTLQQVVTDTFRNNDRSGSLLAQTYTITNPTDTTISLELIRYLDGDLNFDNSLIDGGGRLPVGINGLETLFETDQSGNAETDSTFVGITAEGGNTVLPGRYEIDSYSGLQSRIDAGSALDDAITGDSSPVDQFVDSGAGYDITLALRNVFELAPGTSTSYTALTQYGSGGAITVVPQLFSIAATDANKAEGNSGFLAFTFTITRSGDLSSTTTLNYAVTGSGSNPADAADFGGILPSGVVTFAPNETSKLVTINISSDTVVESTKDFTVTLSNPSNTASITTATATGTIINDDAPLGNTAPVLVNAIAAQLAKQDTAFSFTFDANTFIDVDANDSLTYSATLQDDSNLPSWLNFNAATRTFSGTPTNSNVGNLNIKLTATDTSNKTAIANFALQVDNVNDAPTLQNAIADQIAAENTAFSFTFDANTFIDVDAGDNLTYSATLSGGSNLPSWLTFNADTRTFSGTPTNADEGNLTIEVRAKDNSGVSTIDTFALAVEHNSGVPTFNLAKIADDIFKISNSSGKSKLKITLTDRNSNLVNELGVFTVDDAIGNINGIAPGTLGYTQAALERSQVIFSAISNIPNGFNTDNFTRMLEFNPDDNLRFYLVKNSSTNAVRAGITPLTDIVFSDSLKQKVTDLGSEQFSLGWKDGSSTSDFKDMVVKIQSINDPLPLGTNLQGNHQGAMIDLRGVTTEVKADFVVNREAAFDNFIGFYKVTDENGGIDTNGDGTVDILTGQPGYAEAAIRGRVAGIDLTVNNQGTATYSGTLQPGFIFAPFIIANGSPDALLDTNPNNNPAVYFPFLGANTDKVDHIRLLGNNVFGFEDLANGGDKDFNDAIVRVNLSIT